MSPQTRRALAAMSAKNVNGPNGKKPSAATNLIGMPLYSEQGAE